MTLAPKKDVLGALLEEGNVFLHIDPHASGVRIPHHLRDRPTVVLELGYEMAIPIPDLDISAQGVNATLSFGQAPFFCHLPWKSVFAMISKDGRVLLWPKDVPAHLADTLQSNPPRPEPPSAPKTPKEENRRRFGVIDGGRSAKGTVDDGTGPQQGPTHLRVLR